MQTMKTDAELLEAFAESRDQAAFAELVARYGAMVYRVCFRTLRDMHEAEDASQAVFLALVEKASTLRREGTLASWLHTVARQTALYLVRTRINRAKRESASVDVLTGGNGEEIDEAEREAVLRILDEELSRLSAGQREAVILRYLQGRSEKEAAVIAGCAGNTLSRRACNGIARLRDRLRRRGCALAVPVLIGVLEAELRAAVPHTLLPSLMAMPELAAANVGSGNIVTLMNGAMAALFMMKLKMACVVAGLAALVGIVGVTFMGGVGERDLCGARNVASDASQRTAVASLKPAVQERNASQSKQRRVAAGRSAPARNFLAEAEKAVQRKEDTWDTLREVAYEWTLTDAEAPARWTEQLTEGDDREYAMFGVALGWAENDPAAAAAWVERWPAGSARDGAVMCVAFIWAERESASAAAWAEQLPEGDARAGALAKVASQWAVRDPASAAAWSERLPEGGARDVALAKVALRWAERDPASAAAWGERLPEGEARRWALSNVAGEWSAEDPQAAARLAERLPDGEACSDAYSKVVMTWAENDTEAAAGWVERMPAGEGRDVALAKIASRWGKKDPDAAAAWAARLSNEDAMKTLRVIVPEWAKKDAQMAKEWIEQSLLADAAKTELLKLAVGK